MENIEITDEYLRARKDIKDGIQLTFITGKAGTGKSTLIEYLRNTLDMQIAVVAPTGVAALNAKGVTIHSFFRMPTKIITNKDIRYIFNSEVYKELELLIIDEVSMVRADLMDGIDAFLRMNRGIELPFGGVQVLFVGDLYQLPPVVKDDELPIMQKLGYKTEFFFSSKVMKSVGLDLNVINLEKVFRQRDPTFIDVLNAIRTRDVDNLQTALQSLNGRLGMPPGKTDIILACTNKVVAEKNEDMLKRLKTPMKKYLGRLSGDFVVKGSSLPAPMDLCLKVDTQVMLTQNDPDKCWVNGSLGIVTKLEDRVITVRLLQNNREVFIYRAEWQSYEYKMVEGKLKATVAGEYTQFPLTPAWAMTIHKSQGKTLDSVYLDLGRGAFAAGQVYVALSRVRTLSSLKLAKPVKWADIKVNSIVNKYHEYIFRSVNEPVA